MILQSLLSVRQHYIGSRKSSFLLSVLTQGTWICKPFLVLLEYLQLSRSDERKIGFFFPITSQDIRKFQAIVCNDGIYLDRYPGGNGAYSSQSLLPPSS